jgi:hypothetical protein
MNTYGHLFPGAEATSADMLDACLRETPPETLDAIR